MTNHNNKKINNSVVAAVGGVVLGAGLAIAGALALKDKKISTKVSDVIKDLKSETKNLSKKIQDGAQSTKNNLEKKAADTQKTVKKIIKESK